MIGGTLLRVMGAVVGGGIAATVAWIQTRVMLRHEVDLLRSQLEADREAGRAALRRTAATDALEVTRSFSRMQVSAGGFIP